MNIEDLLSETERSIVFKGKFNGSFSRHAENIWAIDYDITAECDAKRKKVAGTSDSNSAKAIIKAFDAHKLEQTKLVTVTKASAQEIKGAKLLSMEPGAYKLKAIQE
jgi:hypothetical protein